MHTRFAAVFLGLVSPMLFAAVSHEAPVIPDKACQTISNSAEAASSCNALGILDLKAGDSKAGEVKFREAIELATAALGDSHPDVALYEGNLALALALEHQYGRAEVLLHRARYIVNTTLPSDDGRLATVLAELCAVETAEKNFPQAEADAQQALAIVARQSGAESLEGAVQQVVLGTVYLREKKLVEADRMLSGAVALERRVMTGTPSADLRVLAQAIRSFGELRALQHNWREAKALYSEAIGIYESTSGANHPALGSILQEYADVLKHSGVPREQVKSVEDRAKAIRTVKA